MIKKILSITFLTLALAGGFKTVSVHAASPSDIVCQQVTQVDEGCVTKKDRIFGKDDVVNKAFGVLTFLAGTAAVLIIIIAGLMYVFSTGDPQNTGRAKDAILYAVIGLVVVVAARLIVNFIISSL